MSVSLAIGTRIHLGKASTPPTDESLRKVLSSLYDLIIKTGAVKGVIAVDGDDTKIPGYSLKDTLSNLLMEVICQHQPVTCVNDADSERILEESSQRSPVTILPVTPWGNFIPALNAIVSWAASSNQYPPSASHLLLISAETSLTAENVSTLVQQCSLDDTLVAGAVLPGHDFRGNADLIKGPIEVPLTGRTTPWNTAAVWNVPQLALTGFPLVAEGVHRIVDKDAIEADGTAQNEIETKITSYADTTLTVQVSPGVEEVSTIALQQTVWKKGHVKAKLVPLSNIEWHQTWADQERQIWHEAKMKSKEERAGVHLDIIFGGKAKCEAVVLHY